MRSNRRQYICRDRTNVQKRERVRVESFQLKSSGAERPRSGSYSARLVPTGNFDQILDSDGGVVVAGAATVEKALDVLFFLHDSGGALGLSEIGRALDLPKSSCHRLLAALVEREVVDRDGAGRYRPGLALLSLGIGASSRRPRVLVRPSFWSRCDTGSFAFSTASKVRDSCGLHRGSVT